MSTRWKIRKPERVRIFRWEGGLALVIPTSLTAEIAAREGSSVEIAPARGQLIVRPAPVHVELDDLLAEVTVENLHRDLQIGDPPGHEGW